MDKNNGGKDMLKDLFKKKEVEEVEMQLSINDLQMLSDFVASKLDEKDSKKKKKMGFEEYYTTPMPIKFSLIGDKLRLAEDLTNLYADEKED